MFPSFDSMVLYKTSAKLIMYDDSVKCCGFPKSCDPQSAVYLYMAKHDKLLNIIKSDKDSPYPPQRV